MKVENEDANAYGILEHSSYPSPKDLSVPISIQNRGLQGEDSRSKCSGTSANSTDHLAGSSTREYRHTGRSGLGPAC